MDIHRKLRKDAARYKDVRPPANLREQLKTALEGASRPIGIRPWFKPAVAAMAAAMVLVFAGTLYLEPASDADYSARLAWGEQQIEHDAPESRTQPETTLGQNDQHRSRDDAATEQAASKPVAGPVAFGLLSLATGVLLTVGLWGRRALLPLLMLLAAVSAGGLLLLLG